MGRGRLPLVALVAAMLLLTACGGSPGGTGSGGDTFTIGLSAPELKGSFWISIYYGVEDEARKQGVNLVTVEAGGYENVQTQIEQMEDLIQRGVDLILIGATSSEAVAPVVEEAVRAGIPVIGLSGIPATDQITAAIGADHYGMGRLQAQCIAEAIGGSGQVAMASGPPGVIWAEERARGFRDTITQEYPDIEIVAEQNTPTGRDQGLNLAEQWMQAFPNLRGVYTATDDIGAGYVDPLLAANRLDDVAVASSNLSPIGREYLMAGYLVCQSIQQIVLQGREGIRIAIQHLKGEEVPRDVVTEAILVTRDNIDDLDLSEFQAPEDYRPQL